MDIFTSIKNSVIYVINILLSWLPDCPFDAFIKVMDNNELLRNVNWFIPFSDMVAIGQAWLVAIGIFYLYQLILRWVKAIE